MVKITDDQESQPELPPEFLRKFEAEEWGPGDLQSRYERWMGVRNRWRSAHDGSWPVEVALTAGGLLYARTMYAMRRWVAAGGPGDPPDEWNGAIRAAEEAAEWRRTR